MGFDSKTAQRSALCRSRRELSNAYLLANFGFDTAEKKASKVCPIERCRGQLAAYPAVQPSADGVSVNHLFHSESVIIEKPYEDQRRVKMKLMVNMKFDYL